MIHLDRLKGLLNKILAAEEAERKVSTTQMKLIINRDALLVIKSKLEQYIQELENEQ